MKKSLWIFAFVLPGMMIVAQPSMAYPPCGGGLCGGCICTRIFPHIHQHGPLYSYGPYDNAGAGCAQNQWGPPERLFAGWGGKGCGTGCGDCGGGHLKANLFSGWGWKSKCGHGCADGTCGGHDHVANVPMNNPMPNPVAQYASYGNYYGMPAYGSVTANTYVQPAPVQVTPRSAIVPVSYGSPAAYGSYWPAR